MRGLSLSPVIASDGHTYDKKSLKELFESMIFTSPITRERLNPQIMIPNLTLKKILDDFKINYSDFNF